MCGNMYIVCWQYVCSMKVANQSLLPILSRVRKGSEISVKSVKGKVHEEPNGESVMGSGMEKHLSSYLPQGVQQCRSKCSCSECLGLERRWQGILTCSMEILTKIWLTHFPGGHGDCSCLVFPMQRHSFPCLTRALRNRKEDVTSS